MRVDSLDGQKDTIYSYTYVCTYLLTYVYVWYVLTVGFVSWVRRAPSRLCSHSSFRPNRIASHWVALRCFFQFYWDLACESARICTIYIHNVCIILCVCVWDNFEIIDKSAWLHSLSVSVSVTVSHWPLFLDSYLISTCGCALHLIRLCFASCLIKRHKLDCSSAICRPYYLRFHISFSRRFYLQFQSIFRMFNEPALDVGVPKNQKEIYVYTYVYI